MSEARFLPAAEVVRRALSVRGRGRYRLGAGGVDPAAPTPFDGGFCDCSGYVCWALGVPRHPSRELWFYTDQMAADGRDPALPYFDLVEPGNERPGDVLVYRGIDLDGDHRRDRVGHCALIVGVFGPRYRDMKVAQCQAAKTPAVVVTSGHIWESREVFRGRRKPSWGSVVVRPVRG